MSNMHEMRQRMATHHYSQDDRTLAYKYQKELEPVINKFIDDFKETNFFLGTFNLAKEPWRLVSVGELRKFGLKLLEKPNAANKDLTDLSFTKKKLTKQRLG